MLKITGLALADTEYLADSSVLLGVGTVAGKVPLIGFQKTIEERRLYTVVDEFLQEVLNLHNLRNAYLAFIPQISHGFEVSLS